MDEKHSHVTEPVGRVIDGLIGLTGITSPVWIEYLHSAAALLMGVGGVILLALRIGVAWREYKAKRRPQPAEKEIESDE